MSLSRFKLGFKQNLMLVVVLTVVGFAALIFLSISSLNSQSRAAERVDTLGRWVIDLSSLRSEVSTVSRLSGKAAEAALPEFQATQDRILGGLSAQGMRGAEELDATLDTWLVSQSAVIKDAQAIGNNNAEGQRKVVADRQAEFLETLFSFMRKPFQKMQDSIAALIEQRSPESFDAFRAAKSELRQTLVELDFVDTFDAPLEEIATEVEALISLIQHQNQEAVSAEAQLKQFNQQVDQRFEQVLAQLEQARNDADSASKTARTTILIAGIGVAAAVLLLLMLTLKRSTTALNTTVTSLEKVAAGDLELRLPVSEGRQDEFDRLGVAVNHLNEQLGSVLNSVKESSSQLQHMSTELSDTLKTQIAESEQTESETGSVAAAAEEISQTVAEMANASEETNRLSGEAEAATEKGGAVITGALGSLEQISALFARIHDELNRLNEASSRVDGVTDMINGLAEQTNLLALNAAIEAARAGEAGRGFSVVADEVRSLAEKTVSATSSINDINNNMQGQMNQILRAMEDGQHQVNESRSQGGEAIHEMEQIRSLFGEVSDRNQQQAASIEQIAATAQSIAHSMNAVLDNVSRGSERTREIGGFSTEVVSHADNLQTMTSRFRC
ncbi:methyl-accepting chemotaxis protein [Marinobacterium lutimaris]|uniref:Methyl-accepting chemotaxis protein n=1 Tax=Marinobacterium lutimaris TaxID=568106 RepID=A0A1H5YFZ6_9GAMM|nr:methyl-accepting chemotaxis protein [Marinobacterium lutimaris]SEG22326.1 Methyl-accepting chemotaxis protein [Marinobacterium lutimaris]